MVIVSAGSLSSAAYISAPLQALDSCMIITCLCIEVHEPESLHLRKAVRVIGCPSSLAVERSDSVVYIL